MDFDTQYLDPLSEPETVGITAELLRELSDGHELQNFTAHLKAVARVKGRDDFVFTTGDVGRPYALVHLTWSVETSPNFPWTVLCKDNSALNTEILDIFGL